MREFGRTQCEGETMGTETSGQPGTTVRAATRPGKPKPSPGRAAGRTSEAGAGASDAELTREVARQTASDRAVERFFEREHEGTSTDIEAAKATGDQVR